MNMQTAGIHHVTAFVGDPQRNVDFYAGVLGLRLVKKTINFDAPEIYHLYFGDEAGSPGTIITFFPAEGSRRGRIGGGQVGVTTYAIPAGTMGFWKGRLAKFGITSTESVRFGEHFVQFSDPDGLLVALVERSEGKESTWSFGGVPANKAIKGFGGALLYSTAPERTSTVLTEVLGLVKFAEEAGFIRFRAAGDIGQVIDMNASEMEPGIGGAGTVHHIAWRAKDYTEHEEWRANVEGTGLSPTPIVDRQYFNAIYFREPGGILFEIATDPPGFAKDEEPNKLGEKLMLPEWYEPHREQIQSFLKPFEVRVLKEDK